MLLWHALTSYSPAALGILERTNGLGKSWAGWWACLGTGCGLVRSSALPNLACGKSDLAFFQFLDLHQQGQRSAHIPQIHAEEIG